MKKRLIGDKVTFSGKDYYVITDRNSRLTYKRCDEFYAIYDTTTP